MIDRKFSLKITFQQPPLNADKLNSDLEEFLMPLCGLPTDEVKEKAQEWLMNYVSDPLVSVEVMEETYER